MCVAVCVRMFMHQCCNACEYLGISVCESVYAFVSLSRCVRLPWRIRTEIIASWKSPWRIRGIIRTEVSLECGRGMKMVPCENRKGMRMICSDRGMNQAMIMVPLGLWKRDLDGPF